MIFLEAGSQLHLRPSHLLLMIYRYVSGIYQTGEVSALSYTKGYLDHQGKSTPGRRVLTVSSHGISEAEMWLSERLPDARIETVSLKLIDSQLFQFLKHARQNDIASVVEQFSAAVTSYPILSELAADPGLVPYWNDQAERIRRLLGNGRFIVYSEPPNRIPRTRIYDFIYVTHSQSALPTGTIELLKSHLDPKGLMAVLVPNRDEKADSPEPFAISGAVREATSHLHASLEGYGYSRALEDEVDEDEGRAGAFRTENIGFNVLAPARAVMIGELLLESLYDHIPDGVRLSALEHAAEQFESRGLSVQEQLTLYFHGDPEVWS